MEQRRGSGLIAFLGGMAAGAVLGVLFAPHSGKETRERLAGHASEAQDALQEAIGSLRERWAKARGKAADAATLTKDEVEDLIRFIIEEGKDLAGRVREDVEGSEEAAAERVRHAAEHIRDAAR